MFGGDDETTQISKINNCSLERIGYLDFKFELGACAAVNEESIYLCFDLDDAKQCHVGADPVGTFSKITESEFYHTATRIGANEGNDFVKTLG